MQQKSLKKIDLYKKKEVKKKTCRDIAYYYYFMIFPCF